MLFKNNYYKVKSSLFIVILLLLGSAIWNQAYLESQNILLKNPNWYSYRSKLVDSFASTFSISMSRIALSGRELNLRTSKGSDMILNRHQAVLKELEFTFRIMNNSHLDILYNFKDGASSFFRLSRSSLYDSGMYKIDVRGVYTRFLKIDFTADSDKKYRGHLKQTDEGIVFSVDNRVVAVSLGDKFEKLEFGFESGMVGVLISDIKAYDVNGATIDTFLDNNSGWARYYLKNLFILILITFVVLIISISLKKNCFKVVLSALQFTALLGILWLVYDFYYYAKKDVFWGHGLGATKFYTTPEKDIDFEVIRWHVFSTWARLMGDKPISQADYDQRFGVFYKNSPRDYCLNSKCSSIPEKEKIKQEATNKKTIRLGVIGLSALDSTGIRPDENSAFVEMHKEFFKENSGKMNVESFNLSRPSLFFKTSGDQFISDLLNFKIDVVVIVLKIRYNTSQAEMRAFGNFLKQCKEHGIKTIFINDPINPEKIVYLTSKQVQDILEVDRLNHKDHNKILYPVLSDYFKYDLTIVEPDEVLFDMKNIKVGKIWWDDSHFTSYGHELFGKWIANKVGAIVGR